MLAVLSTGTWLTPRESDAEVICKEGVMDLKTVVLMLLNGEEVVITDDLNQHFVVKLEKVPEGVDYAGATTLVIRSERLKG